MTPDDEIRARERAAFIAGGIAGMHDARQEYMEWLDHEARTRYQYVGNASPDGLTPMEYYIPKSGPYPNDGGQQEGC